MSSPYKFSEWTYVDKAIAENNHICTRCHCDITSDHIEKPVLPRQDVGSTELRPRHHRAGRRRPKGADEECRDTFMM